MGMHNRRLGQLGEDLALRILQAHGYRILQKNVRTPFGEIDILARDVDVLVAIEVKTRSTRGFCHAHRALHYPKRQRLYRCLMYLWRKYPHIDSLRVDGVLLGIDAGKRLTDCEVWKGI